MRPFPLSLRALLSITDVLDLGMLQLDVKTAFLKGDLEEEFYMAQLDFISHGHAEKVCMFRVPH